MASHHGRLPPLAIAAVHCLLLPSASPMQRQLAPPAAILYTCDDPHPAAFPSLPFSATYPAPFLSMTDMALHWKHAASLQCQVRSSECLIACTSASNLSMKVLHGVPPRFWMGHHRDPASPLRFTSRLPSWLSCVLATSAASHQRLLVCHERGMGYMLIRVCMHAGVCACIGCVACVL
ncbi:uncharacterized protein LOC125521652 [Triticum urartu]|uniref:uncharacterized protein LOC125521652 n=1 Tax=Triticum urartu TaxID=4572 RepID=UPI002043B67A|nr:uncharacterized protein LOC125521652 [Triticum urartu]